MANKQLKKKTTHKKKIYSTRKYKQYPEQAVRDALNAIARGVSVREASVKYKVPFSTVRSKYKEIYPLGKKSGPKTILTDKEEHQLVDWIRLIGSKGFPVTKNMLLDSVQLLIKELKRENPFTEGRPRRHWLEGFLRRHPGLSIRTAQNLNKRRADVTEEQLRAWFKEVKDYLKSKNLVDIHPSQIFNCDETAFCLNPKGNKVIHDKKLKSVYTLVGSNEKECLTVLITGNAIGQMPPPMVMFAYTRIPAVIVEKIPDDWSVGKSDNGWMTGETFYEYITNIFYPWCIKNKIQFPILMYLDGHSSHTTMALSDFCVAHRIELISLYPNATHIIQPMDVALFRPLKEAWKNAVANWRIKNNGVALKKHDFSTVLKAAIDSINVQKCLLNGFTCCGLSPLSADAVDYTKLINNQQALEQDNTNMEHLLSVTAKNGHEFVLNYIEQFVDVNILQLFKTAANPWYGEEKYKKLFALWRNCKELSNSDQTQVESNELNVQTNIVIETVDLNFNEDLNNLDLENVDIVFVDNIDTNELNINQGAAVATSDDVSNPEESQKKETEKSSDNMNSNNIQQGNLGSNISTENICCNKYVKFFFKIDVTDVISTPFKNALFWPTSLLSPNKKKKDKVPAVATSEKWREYHQLKLNLKRKREEEKEEKKRIRLEKLKIKKEKEEEKAQLKTIREEKVALNEKNKLKEQNKRKKQNKRK